MSSRTDVGALWENYLVIERMKRNAYMGQHRKYYFWRTYDRQEIDFIEECGESLGAFQFKFKEGARKKRLHALWSKTYPESSTATIDQGQADAFLRVERP